MVHVRLVRFLLCLVTVWLGPGPARSCAAPATPSKDIARYTLRSDGGPRLQVRLDLPVAMTGPRTFVVPRAVPMGYGEQPYDRFIEALVAEDPSGAALPVRRGEGPRWEVGAAGLPLAALRYEVDLDRQEREVLAGADASRVRPGYVALLLYSVLGFIEGLEDTPTALRVEVSPGWPVVLTLAPTIPAPRGRAAARARDFYELADSQVVAGPAAELRMQRVAPAGRLHSSAMGRDPGGAGGVPLFLISYAEVPAGGFAAAAFLGLAADALARVSDYFGVQPLTHYTVVLEHLAPRSPLHGYGMSMEHLHSATLTLAAGQALGSQASEEDRWRARYNLAHHMAHAWIPKRCHGPGYAPFQWELASLIDSIWVSEGFVQYAALAALVVGLPQADAAREREALVERRFRRPLREAPAFLRRMGLLELSRVASSRYSQDFRTGKLVFARGALMAVEIDQVIQAQTAGARGLRDALRALYGACAGADGTFRSEDLAGLLARGGGVPEASLRAVIDRWLAPL